MNKVFISCSMNYDSYTPWLDRNDTEERNEKAKKAYAALLTVTALTPQNEEYKTFSEDVSVKIFNFRGTQ